MAVEDIFDFVLNSQVMQPVYQEMAKGGWTEKEKQTFIEEVPYFLQRSLATRDIVLEGYLPPLLVSTMVGAVKAINSIKEKHNVPFRGFDATAESIGWRPFRPDGKDIDKTNGLTIDTSGATSVPTWVDYIGAYSSGTGVTLSDYHAVVINGLIVGTANATKIIGYQFWSANLTEFPKYFPPAVQEVAKQFGVLFFPTVKVYKIKETLGLRLNVGVKENLGYVPPSGIVIGHAEKYLNNDPPTW